MKKSVKLFTSFFILLTMFACANEEKTLDPTNDVFEEKRDALFELISVMEKSNNFTVVMTASNVPPISTFFLNENFEFAYFEELNIDDFQFELITSRKSVIVEYVAQTGSLAFTDLEGEALSIGIRDGAIVLNNTGYESFSFRFIAQIGALRVMAYQSSFDIFITDEGFVLEPFKNMNEHTNYAQMIGTLVLTTKLDGDKHHDYGFLTNRYLFSENGTRYELSEDSFGDWNQESYDGDLLFDYLFLFKLSPEMFDYEGEQLVLKDIYLKDIFGEEDDLISMRIDVNNNEITVYFSSLIDGEKTLQEVEFKDIGTTLVTLPK